LSSGIKFSQKKKRKKGTEKEKTASYFSGRKKIRIVPYFLAEKDRGPCIFSGERASLAEWGRKKEKQSISALVVR